MLSLEKRAYIANLPVGPVTAELAPSQTVTAVDINKLPDGIVTGSNLIQFPAEASPAVRSSVALSLLAAQRVANNDHVILTPDQWVSRHNTVLQNLNWLIEGGSFVKSEMKGLNVAVHQAIIPLLTTVFGGVTAGAAILAVLNNLQSMDQQSPWITLFDRQSRRFNVTEYTFSVVKVEGEQVHLNMATARLDASFGITQVLFFKLKNQNAEFESAGAKISAQADLLEDLNDGLKVKLAAATKAFIAALPDNIGQV